MKIRNLFFVLFILLALAGVVFAAGELKGKTTPIDDWGKETPKEEINKTTYKDLNAKHIYGDITFKEDINSTRTKTELLSKLIIEQGRVSTSDSELKNKPATITFKNFCAKNPIILHNGIWKEDIKPVQTALCQYTINIDHWSEWSIIDSTWNGTFNSTTLYSNSLGLDPDLAIGFNFEDYAYFSEDILDVSAWKTHATVEPKYSQNGTIDDAIVFYGDQTIEIQQDESLKFESDEDFSVCLWFNATNTGTQMSMIDSSSLVPRWEVLVDANGFFGAHMHDGGGPLTVLDNADITGSWTHGCAVFNRTGDLTIYVNGIEETSSSMTGVGNIDNNYNLFIGSNQDSTLYYEGDLDEIKIFNKVLSANEISEMYTNESIGIKYINKNLDSTIENFQTNYWNFEETSGNLLDQIGNINGIVDAGVDVDEPGIKNRGYYFDGLNTTTDYVDLNDAIIHDWDAVTLSVWFKPGQMPSDGTPTARKIIGAVGGSSNYMTFTETTNALNFYYRNQSNHASTCSISFDDEAETGEWHHLVSTIDFQGDGRIYAYMDGIHVCNDTDVLTGDLNAIADFIIGGDGQGRDINGTIDELRIFNKSLNLTEIKDLYRYSPLVLHNWMDFEGYEDWDTSIDDSGIGNDGDHIGWTAPGAAVPATFGQGTYFDGQDTYFETSSSQLQFGTEKNFSIAFWVNPEMPAGTVNRVMGTTEVGGGWTVDISSYAIRFFTQLAGGSNYLGTVSNTVPPNQWTHVALAINRNNLTDPIKVWYAGVEQAVTHANPQNITDNINSSSNLMVGRIPFASTSMFNGSLDNIKIFPRIIDITEVIQLNNSDPNWIYAQGGSYLSEVYNSSDYEGDIHTNVWTAVTDSGLQDVSLMKGRAGNCSTILTESWTNGMFGTWNASQGWIFSSVQGECFQYDLSFSGDGESITTIDNVTIHAYKIKLPVAENVTVTNDEAKTLNNIEGLAYFLVNDTDTGTLLYEWYINNVNVFNNTVTGLATGTLSNLSFTWTTKGDQINFSVTPTTVTDFGNVTGLTVWSNNTITINNSEVNITDYYPPNLNFTQAIGRNIAHTVTLYDPDNDATCSWTASNIYSPANQTGSGLTFTPESLNFFAGDVVTVNVTCTDGEYSPSVQWTITMDEGVSNTVSLSNSLLPIMLIICLLVILFACGTYYFENELKYIFFLMCALMSVTGLFVAYKMAMYGFPEISGLLWVLTWIGGIGFFCLIVYVIWRFIEAYKFEDSKKPGLK